MKSEPVTGRFSFKKAALQDFSRFRGKYLRRRHFSVKLLPWQVFSCEFCKFLCSYSVEQVWGTAFDFYQVHSRWHEVVFDSYLFTRNFWKFYFFLENFPPLGYSKESFPKFRFNNLGKDLRSIFRLLKLFKDLPLFCWKASHG